MSMLAERKTKSKWVLNPKASEWSKDQNKLGQKMLEKMGWSAGKGLGARGQGPVEAIRISYKGDTKGLGAGEKKEQEDWLQQQLNFQSLLEGLNGATDKNVKVKSLEEMSKTSRTKIHYHKFARGKDISQYSEKDLSCIVGAGFIPVIDKQSSTPNSTQNGTTELALESQEETVMETKRSKHGRVLKPNAKAADAEEEDTRPRKKKSKEKSSPAGDDEMNPKSRREKRETAQSDGVDSSGEQPQENQADDLETSKRPKRKKKSKQQEVDQAVSSTHVKSKKAKVETILNEEGTAPSSKRTRKANKELAEATALSDDSEQVQPAGKGNRKKAKKEQKTAPEENSRVGKSKKTRKQQNEKADGEEAMEELESINSQSSLIYELIEKAPSALSVGDQPEELKKYCILTSDSDSEH